MASRVGLVSYTGDSEISDEDEVEHESTGHTPPGVVAQGLGIPSSRPKNPSPTPPSFAPAVVQSAPSIGLVAYNADEEEQNESREDSVFFAASTDTRITEEANDPLLDTEDSQPGSTLLVDVTDEPKSEGEYIEFPTQPLFLPLNGVELPPEPTGRCSKVLQEKVVSLLQKEQKLGLDLNKHLQTRKDFRNPSIYEKLVTICDLDEFGTNFPEHLYNPKDWGEESHYNNLLESQKKAYEKREKAKLQDRTKIEFVKGTKRPPTSVVGGSGGKAGGESAKKPRKSKWDVSTADSGGSQSNTPNKLGEIGAQARAQATHLSKELSKLAKQ